MENKNGFTLIELLAVIVVLAIILVIAVPSVTSAINASRNRAFIESYENIVKDVQSRIIQKKSNKSVEIECADTSVNPNYDYVNSKCYSLYDISQNDYSMYVLQNNNVYFVILEGIGKFDKVDYSKNATELIKKQFYPFNHELDTDYEITAKLEDNENYSKNSLMTVISKNGKILNPIEELY